MPSLVKNVVNWGAHLRSSSTASPSNKNPNVNNAPPPVDLCEICGKKPKFVDKGFKHPYCSRSCARNVQGPNGPTACTLRGCRATGKPAFAGFCSDLHAKEGVRVGLVPACDQCKTQPRSVGSFCIPCERQTRGGPRLRELNPDGAAFKNLRAQFFSEWEAPGSTSSPTFEKAYEVILPREFRTRHDQYRSMNPQLTEIRSFHSSQCICDLGYKDSVLCNFKSCGICCTVKSGFKAFAFGAPFNKGRFGDGIYSYRNPALADRFATSCTSSPFRVMIACDVSVEPGQCSDDDQESLFVPVADGILPAYVIMYTK
ncbi:hypothetical protein CC1G_11639 [Coprinopsis cinerea okayama7|uniref:PARP catalytic domain-containing protein n=1 Tax=Coprinopsis cinerea (strain Okayama-7 / 130 / ATCC MYA-4618 / FGSC 9003) TaxID=240176 RepID=A8P481_COPC7|nr:hypothetical protein CC1G_11639 [Coprinopsis cinerea okayama7\|eukprot:XP_001838696.2 hypothetical protein CC1G_11639 [Coprinopsis cinerea okayama7\